MPDYSVLRIIQQVMKHTILLRAWLKQNRYKELIKQAHPDKHPNNKDVAEELTAMINNNRFNYRELLKIKDLVNDKLV